MKSIGDRIKELRKKQNLTQGDLAEKIGMTYVQIGRYEVRGAKPSSEVLSKLADALNTTTDYLMNGETTESNSKALKDKTILGLLQKIEGLGDKDKEMIITFLDAFLVKKQIQQLAV
jgi:transcriptional regulator with XRE-family HTH domain